MQDVLDRLDKDIFELSLLARQFASLPGDENKQRFEQVAQDRDARLWHKLQLQAFRKMVQSLPIKGDEEKALQSLRDDTGGYAVPMPAVQEYLRQAKSMALWDAVTKRYPEQGGRYPLAITQTGLQVIRRRENESHAVTAEHTMGLEGIPVHDLVATPKVTTALLDAVPGYAEERLFPEFLDAAQVKESREILMGTGAGECEGILSHPTISTVNSGNASALTADGIVGLETAVPEPYRSRATWLMSRSTLDAARKLKGSDGQYMFLQVGDAETLRGRPVIVDDNMPNVASNAFPIIFGDLSYYYLVVRLALAVFRDPFTAKGFVIFDLTRRSGGQVVRAEAFVKQKIAA